MTAPSRSLRMRVAKSSREIFVVRRDDERPLLALEPLQQRAELGAALRIERRRRLVHQQQRRIDGQRARDRDALSLAARQLARQRVGAMLDAERLQQLRARRLRAAAGATPCACTGARQTFSNAGRCSNRQWN